MELLFTEEQRNRVTEFVNNKVDIPYLSERMEARIFMPAIKAIEALVVKYLPKDLIAIALSTKAGLADEAGGVLRTRLVTLLNEKINIPFINEEKEGNLIAAIVEIIASAIRDNTDIEAETLKLAA